MPQIRTMQGITLIELLITFALMGIIILFVSPAFTRTYQKIASENRVLHFASLLRHAKSHALMTSIDVTICASKSGNSCDGSWTDGLLGFRDKNADYTIENPNDILFYYQLPSNSGSLSWKSFASKDYIQFSKNGFSFTHNGSLIYQSNDSSLPIYKIIISRQGRIRIMQAS